MNGASMWCPGGGYAWVSGFAWGWTRYRYGCWTCVNSYGWVWQPGRTWTGWNTGLHVVNPPQLFNVPRPPTTPGQTLMVSRGAPAGAVGVSRSEIRGDSAGMGVARGSGRNLGKGLQPGQPAGARGG